MLRLAQAASSETFSEYGWPPNQRRTGASPGNPGGNMDGELNIVPFYGGWAYVFRPIDPELAEYIAWAMTRAVENGAWGGYSQTDPNNPDYPREGLFDALEKLGGERPDPMAIKTFFNCDCSSSTGAVVYHGGVHDWRLRTMWTGNEREILMSTGAFIELSAPLLLELGTGLRRGDILLKPGHTAIAIDSDDHQDTFPVRIEGCAYSRVRSGPGTEYETMGVVEVGKILEADGEVVDREGDVWYRVFYFGETGYTSAVYAKQLPPGKCIADTWLRKTAGTAGEQIIVIPKGAVVYLTGNSCRAWSGTVKRTWLECIYGGHQGWASSLNIQN